MEHLTTPVYQIWKKKSPIPSMRSYANNRADERSNGWTDGRTAPYHTTSRLKTGV